MSERLSILNDPPKVLEGPQLLHKLIQWDQHKSKCALDFTSGGSRQRYTYEELRCLVDSLVLRIQESLSKTNSQTEQPLCQHIVPVLLPQSPSLYISQLAILQCGGAFCAINLDAPQERIKFVVGDVSANLLITTSEFRDVVSWENGPIVIVVDEFPLLPEVEVLQSGVSRDLTPEDLAYVMYTSGSSGTPKGVAVSHLAVSQSLLAHERHIPPFNRFLQFAAPSFDVSVFEIFFPLTRGCTLVGCKRNQLLNDLPGMLNELEVDAAELTPTVVGSLLQKRANAPGLKLLLTIGEMLTTPIVEEFGGSEAKPCMLYGMYGPTEAAIHCTIYPEMASTAKPGNIGVPFDTVSVFIAAASNGPEDAADLKFLPIGELGELVLGGSQLAHGYLNRREQNKVAFVVFEGRSYYRTGDKARQLEDGTIEILGRISAGQVKIRGQRVELGEIEEAVYKHPGVKTVSAVVLGGILVVFTLVGEELSSADDVMETCAKWLPKFMMPSEIILLQNFPYLPSGKVDKRKLVADYQEERDKDESANAADMSETGRAVKEVLQELLGAFPSKMRLAAIGLDSLAAIRVSSRLWLLGFNVNTVAILKCDTLNSLIRLCENSISCRSPDLNSPKTRTVSDIATALNGNAKDVESTMLCTPIQSAMLAETALDETAYQNWVELELAEVTDLQYVIVTIYALSEANSILRTGFTESPDSDGYVQIIWRKFQDSQIKQVTKFNYEFDPSKDASLHHPIRIQLLQTSSSTRLLMHIHHALYDAWSLELLLDDLDTILCARPLPERPPFANVVEGYTDGTLKYDDWISKDYWKDHLSHLDISQMPSFHSRNAPPPGLSITRVTTLISTLDVEATARRLLSSPQSLFQAAYALILGSYLGSTDICFGTIFSGRTLPIVGIEDIVGPCLATLPVRVDLSLFTTIQDLVRELNITNRKHLEFCDVPLRDIKSASDVHPQQLLFDTLLIWQQTLHTHDHKRKHVSLIGSVDNLEFNLTLEIIPGSKNLEMKANFQRSLFPESQVKNLLRQIEQLVRVIVEDRETPLDGVFNRLSSDVLSIENESPDLSLKGGSLSSPVEKIALEDPERTAIEFAKVIENDNLDTHRMSYSELNSRANQMGHYLLEQNVRPDELLCICLEKSADLYTSILAIAKIGAGYLPITPDIPSGRLEHILREAKVKVLMAETVSRPLLKSLQGLTIIYIDEVKFMGFPSRNISLRSPPENLAYCVFTSGSTGAPKGVLVTQGNLLSNLDVLEDLYPTSKESRFLQSCSQAFDVSVFEIFFAWRAGGCLCSAVKDILFRDIENAIRVLNITHLSLTPTVAALIDPKNVPKVEFLVTAGEAVTQKVFNAWADRRLWQGYGPSETTNICTVNPKITRYDSINNIGPPFRNTSAFVLSAEYEFRLVPRGGEGEFCFGGSQVFRGYMDRSQEIGKIIDHPKFGRLYRSGDFGRLMPDGSLAFIGRKDDQVKIRGQRVELAEITNVMLRSKAVKDCVTMVVNSEDRTSQRLVSFWTSGLGGSEEFECVRPESSIIEKLYENIELALPAYMVPSSLIPVSFLPPTSQGKIDKRALVKLFHSLEAHYLNMASKTIKSSSDHTWTELEREIAKAAAQVAQVPLGEVCPDTSFFSLGVDSISAISFSRVLRQSLDHEIQISDILKHPSVVRLANRLASRTQIVDRDESCASKSLDFGFDNNFLKSTTDRFEKAGRSVHAILPCTPLQEAMLSAAESSSEKLYDNHVTLNISGQLEKIKECFKEMVGRHEMLRTCFVNTDMSRYAYAQVVLKGYDLEFGSIASAAERKSARREFDPPYTIDVVESSKSIKLLISMHHALYDGVALSVLYQEVESLYHGKSLPRSVSFAPFLRNMVSLDMEGADNFWSTILKDCVPSRFGRAAQHTSSQESSQILSRIQRTNAKVSLKWIEERTKQNSTSLLAVLHTSWASLVSKKLQETDICFGNVVSGRTVPVDGIEHLIAPCFNTVPTRLQNIHNLSYLEAFRKMQNLNADSLPCQLTPLRRIQSKFSPDGSRLFDTLFILQQPPRDLDSSIWSIAEDDGAVDFPLVCEVVPKQSDDTLEIILHSYTSIFSEEEASALLNDFEERVQTSLQNPRRQILSPAVRDQIITKGEKGETSKLREIRMEGSSRTISADEGKLRDIISSFTDVPPQRIGRDISIFRLGLDSISTVQVAARLRKQGHNVLASDILEHPTIAQLSTYLSQPGSKTTEVKAYDFDAFDQRYRGVICSKHSLNSTRIHAVRPCTAVQKGMLAQTLHSGGQEYVNSIWVELLPEVSVSTVRAAWETVCTNHEMLRTGFALSGDPKNSFLMVTYAKEYFPLPWSEGTGDNGSQTMGLKELLERPWTLTLVEDNGKSTIKFTAHHALYDAQSIQMVISDVAKAVVSLSVSPRPSITSLLGAILRYSEDDIDSQKLFWEKEESKIIVNRFPDLTSLQISDQRSEVRELSSQSSVESLEELCRHNGVTMQAAAQATWARLLAAYIGESSTTFGMILSGHLVHESADNICFPSIVTLPVRCDVTGTNAELLSRTMTSNSSLHKYQFTPLTSIQKWAGFPEGKIFDTLLAYQKLPDGVEEVEFPWKIVREEASVDYAVSLEVQPTKSGKLTLRLTFRVDLIPIEQAELLLRQYDALLQDILRSPDSPCDLTPEVDNELLSITPAKDYEIGGQVTLLHEYVERGAQQWPKKVALEFATSLEPGYMKSRSWTYEQLSNESNKVAHLLLKHQVTPGQIIAICFDKCAEASFAIIGILKAGCAYVALDPNAPADRLKFIVKDSGASLVLSAGKPGQVLQGILGGIMMLDSPKILAGYPPEQPQLCRVITPQDIAYCLYTSGTTGTPKGCLITHDNTIHFLRAFQRLFAGHWDEDSKYLQFASFHFDVSVMEQFFSWSIGICVASAPRDLIFEDITGAIQQLGITHIDLTPSLARLVYPNDVPSLCKGAFITGGEQLKQEILDVWGEHAVIYNGYGPTEATIGCTMYQRVPKNGKPSNIGPQYDNVGSFVMKPGTELPVLRGGIGELCVSGKLVGKGYLNRPDLTGEKFPTLKSFNERVYRTGDLVRILHDGCFIFLGRADDQVKLRGQRLELLEIDEVIKKSSSSLQEVVTLVLKHATQQKEQLVSFFVKSSSEEDGSLISTVKDACKSRLPGYMVPTHFIPIEALPLNANNKADSKQLAGIYNNLTIDDLRRLSQSSQQDKEWTEEEKRIVQVLAEVMQVEQSALTHSSNIFELGLDSISIIGFSRTLQNSGLENAKLSVVKNNPSIGRLVNALLGGTVPDQGRENAYVAASQAMAAFSQRHMVHVCTELGTESADIETIVPCTPVQEGMIYKFQESEYPLYFNKFEFRLDERVDTKKLFTAWNRVIARLQVLRTKFVSTDDGYAQVVLKIGSISWVSPLVDYESAEKSVALKTPFTLNLSSTKKHLTFRIFHGLYDGNSLTMLLRRVVEEYVELESIEYGPSFTSSLPYGPLAQAPEAQKFWSSHLKDWSSQPMPTISESTEDVAATATIKDLAGFEAFRKQLGVTPQAVIQAVWLSVLQNLTSSSLTIGIVASGRAIDFEGADTVIGPLFNTIPFHIKLEPRTSSASLITKCHEFNLQMQDFQHTPLKDIQKWSSANRGQPLFDTLFVFQRPEIGDEEIARGIWTQVDSGQVADYPLAFEANLSPDSSKLELTIVAQGSAITQAEAADLLEQVRKVLDETIQNTGKNIIFQYEDGRVEHGTNGHDVPERRTSITPSEAFTWTRDAHTIKEEIALLAKVSKEAVHENSSIFELGLDSIDVIKLSSRLQKRGIEIPVSAIIKSQSIAMISLNISPKEKKATRSDGKSLYTMSRELTAYLEHMGMLPEDVETVLPATPLQQSMVNETIKSGYTRYLNVDGFKLTDNVDPDKLLTSVKTVVEKSPILRTTFVEIDDPKLPVSYAQITHKELASSIGNFSMHTLGDNPSFEVFMDQFKAESAVLAAQNQTLLRVYCVSAGNSWYLVIAISHALYDGTSLRSIHEDIQQAYHGALKPRPNFLPFLEYVFQSTTEEAKKFWRATLSNLPPAIFPRKELSNDQDSALSTRLERRSRVPLQKIEELCKSARITLQTLGQTCWALVLSHLMGQLDVVFASVLSCRDSDEADEVMFPLMNTVAVRSVLHGRLLDMLKYMQEMSDTTRQYQHFPLGTAQAYALASRQDQNSTKDTTLFDTLFIYQGRRSTDRGGQLYESVYGAADVEFPVCSEMEIVDDEFVSWTTACKSVVAADAKRIIEALETVLEHIVANPEAQTIITDVKGISVCGLPRFKKSETKPKLPPALLVNGVDNEWSSTEITIRKALHEISSVPEDAIRKDSTIFHLGLDSILVLKLPALLKKYGIRLSVSDILTEQTVHAMAQAAAKSTSDVDETLDVDSILASVVLPEKLATELVKLEKEVGEIQCVMPATPGELYMVRQWQASRGAMFYQTFTYSLPAPVNKTNLEVAWRELLRRHDILRTSFLEVGADIVQVVFKDPLNEVIYDSRTRKYRRDLRIPPLNLVVEESDASSVVVKVVLHHALYDGISLPILIEEFQSLYQGQVLPEPTTEFRTFIAQSISASTPDSTKEKWMSYLEHETLYPTHSSVKKSKKRTEFFQPLNQISNIKQLAQDSGVSIDALFLAAVSMIYAHKLPTDTANQVVFGIYLANRAPFGEDLSNLAAPTLNLLPLRVRDPLSRSITQLAKEIQKAIYMISSREMVSASLAAIYAWTGVRVNFFVNILKPANSGARPKQEEEWLTVQDLGKRAEVVEEVINEEIEVPDDGRWGAYMPSVDLEFRYHGEENKLDMGIFAPTEMLSVEGAEGMIWEFMGFFE